MADPGLERRMPIVGWWVRITSAAGGSVQTVIGRATALDTAATRGYAAVEVAGSWRNLGPGYGGDWILEAMAEQKEDLK